MEQSLGLGIALDFQDRASAGLLKTEAIFGKTYKTSKELTTALDQNIRKFQGLAQAGAMIAGLGYGMQRAGKGLLNPLKGAYEEAKAYEKEMASLKFVTGAVGDELQELQDITIQTGINTMFSPQQATEALYELASAGLSTDKSIAALGDTLDLVALSGGKLSLSMGASTMAATLNKFNLDVSESTRVVDMLARATQLTNFHIEEFPSFMDSIKGTPALMERPMEELLATAGIMRNLGESPRQVGQNLVALERQIVQAATNLSQGTIGSKGGRKKKAYEDLGLDIDSFYDAEGALRPLPELIGSVVGGLEGMTQMDRQIALQNALGVSKKVAVAVATAEKGYVKLDEATGEYVVTTNEGKISLEELTKEFSNVNGEAKDGANAFLETAEGVEVLRQGSIDTFKILMGQTLIPIISKFYQFQIKILNKLIEFVDAYPRLAKALGYGMGLAGLLLVVGGTALMVVGALIGLSAIAGIVSSKFIGIGTALGWFTTKTLSASTVAGKFMGILKGVGTGLLKLLIPFAKVIAVVGLLYAVWKSDFAGIRTLVTDFSGNVIDSFKRSNELVEMETGEMRKNIRELRGEVGEDLDLGMAEDGLISQVNGGGFFDKLTYHLGRFKAFKTGISEIWGDGYIDADTYDMLDSFDLLPHVGIIMDLKAIFGAFFGGIKDGFIEAGDFIREGVVSLFESLDLEIPGWLEDLLDFDFSKIINNIWDFTSSVDLDSVGDIFGTLSNRADESGLSVGNKFIDSLIGGFLFRVDFVKFVLGNIFDFWMDRVLNLADEKGIDTGNKYVDALLALLSNQVDALWFALSNLFNLTFGSQIDTAEEHGLDTGNNFIDAIIGLFLERWQGFKAIGLAILGWVLEPQTSTAEEYGWDTGNLFIDAIIGGFLNQFDPLIKKAQEIWDALTGIFSKKQTVSVELETAKGGGYTPPEDRGRRGANIEPPQFATGGYIKAQGMGILDPNEYVVNSDLTTMLREFLVGETSTGGNAQEKINNIVTKSSTSQNVDRSIHFDKESLVISMPNGGDTNEIEEMIEMILEKIQRKQEVDDMISFAR